MTCETRIVSQRCNNCRFWSEMLAQSIGCGPVEAVCLSPNSPFHTKFIGATRTCPAWKSGHYGAIDAPPDYGAHTRAAYAKEEDES